MRNIIKLILILTALLAVPVTGAAQVSISASSVTDSFHHTTTLSRLCFQPVDATMTPVGFRYGTTQVLPTETCGTVTLGVLQSGLSVVPNAAGVNYHVYVKASNSNTILRDFGMTHITGSSWSLDTYDPNMAILPVTTIQTGTTTTGPVGSNASCNITGAGAGPFLLNCQIPLAPGGGSPTAPGGDYPNPSSVNTIDIQQAPYYASGSAFTTTTTASSGATSITVGSCGDFVAADAGQAYGSQGVSIAGAGASGAYYIGTVTTCAGTTMVITPATSTSVTGAVVRHDETAAWQSAFNTVSYGDVTNIACPSGIYNINGPQQTVGPTSAILLFPSLNYFSSPLVAPAQLSISGVVPPVRGATVGCILQTAQTSSSGALFSTYATDSGSPWGNQSNIEVYFTNLVIRAYDNPNIAILNGYYLAGMWLQNVFIDTGLPPNCGYDPSVCGSSQTVPPTHSNAIAITTPQLDNYGDVILANVRVYGFYTSIQLQEHADLQSFWGSWGANCLVFNNSTGHAIHGGYVNCEHDTTDLSGTSIGFEIDELSNESQFTSTGTTTILYDPSNNLHGSFSYENYYTSGSWSTTFQNGGINVSYCNLLNSSCFASGAFSAVSVQAKNITGSTQCVQADTSGNLTGTGSACGTGGGGSVTQIIAGSGISVSPGGGTGNVTVSATGGGSSGPVFKGYTFVADSSATSVTSPSFPVTAGDLLVVSCRFGTGTTGIATDSASNSYTALTAQIDSSVGIQQSWAIAASSGSTTFTCTQGSSAAGISLIALDYSGTLTSANTSAGSNASITTGPFTTTQRTIDIYCGAVGALTTWTPSIIAGGWSTLRGVSDAAIISSAADQGCADFILPSTVSGGNASITPGNNVLSVSSVLAFNY